MQSGVSAADPFFGISALSIQQQEANGAVLVTRTISSSTQRTNTSTAPKRFPHSRTIATGSPHSSSPGKGYARRHAAATAAKAVHRTPSNATVNTCRTCSSNSGTTLGGTRVGGAACQHADNDQDHDHEAHAISTATTTQSALLGDGCALSSAGSADPALDADHLNHLHAILDGTATAQSVDAPLAALDSAAITGTAVTNQVSTAAGGTQQQQQPIPPSSAVVSQLQLQSLQQQPQLVQAQDSPGRSLSAVSAGPCPYGHLPPHMREAAIAAAAKAAASGAAKAAVSGCLFCTPSHSPFANVGVGTQLGHVMPICILAAMLQDALSANSVFKGMVLLLQPGAFQVTRLLGLDTVPHTVWAAAAQANGRSAQNLTCQHSWPNMHVTVITPAATILLQVLHPILMLAPCLSLVLLAETRLSSARFTSACVLPKQQHGAGRAAGRE